MAEFNPNAVSVLLDWDGVLFSFNDAALDLCNIKKTPEVLNALKNGDKFDAITGVTRSVLDEAIEKAGPKFWLDAPKLPWANELFSTLLEASKGQLAICTSLGSWYWSAEPKRQRCLIEFGDVPLITCKHKEWVANNHSILVDDMAYQCKAFNSRQGSSYLWPNQYILEANPELIEQSLQQVRSKIRTTNFYFELTQQSKPHSINLYV